MAKKEIKKETPVQVQAKKNAAELKENGFLNPFSPGVTYDAYLATLKTNDKGEITETVEQNLKGKISPELIKWLLNDLQNLKN